MEVKFFIDPETEQPHISPSEEIVMKQAIKQEFPPGWNEKKVRAVIAHYDRQTEEEGAAEIETALEAPGESWISVPTELVDVIARLIEEHEKKSRPLDPGITRKRRGRAKSASRNAPRRKTRGSNPLTTCTAFPASP